MQQAIPVNSDFRELAASEQTALSGGNPLIKYAAGVTVLVTLNILENWEAFKREVRKHATD